MMFDKTLRCHVVEKEDFHENMFKGCGLLEEKPDISNNIRSLIRAGTRPEKKPRRQASLQKVLNREARKLKKFKSLGIDFELPFDQDAVAKINELAINSA